MGRIAGACLGLLIGANSRRPRSGRFRSLPQTSPPTAFLPSRCRSWRRSRPTASSARRSCAAWHPTEREIIITTSFASVPQLHEVKTPGGARTQMTFFTDGVSTRPGRCSCRSGQSFVFQKDTAGGGEADQLFRYDLGSWHDGHADGREVEAWRPRISRTGLIAYDSTERDGKNRDLYVMNPSEPGSTARAGRGRRAMVRDRLSP